MENKINIAELLKDCPQGMELNCTKYSNVYFLGIDNYKKEPKIKLKIETFGTWCSELTLDKYGKESSHPNAKCLIFPKGKTSWDDFVPPCEFKDGDIVTLKNKGLLVACIYKERKNNTSFHHHIAFYDGGLGIIVNGENVSADDDLTFVTEEEKAKLFQAIKEHGYKWNAETKTLEKLVEPKFKVGDKVRHKNNHNVVFTITNIGEDSYVCGAKMAFWFDDQDNYELVPNKFDITTLTPFESRVLVRYNKEAKWCPAVWGFYDYEKGLPHRYAIVGGITFAYCIPYKGNEHLLGKTDDCDDFYKTW